MVFRYPYFDPSFFAWFSPLLVGVITTHCFAKPRLRPWWLAVISSVWVIVCLIFGFLLWVGVSARFMNPTELSPEQIVLIFAGGWLFSGLVCIWAPEALRRLAESPGNQTLQRTGAARRGFEVEQVSDGGPGS